MDKFRQILAATDFSAPRVMRLSVLPRLPGRLEPRLTLLHVANLGPLEKMQQWMMSTAIDLKARLLNGFTKSWNTGRGIAAGCGVAAGCRVKEGVPLSELISQPGCAGCRSVCLRCAEKVSCATCCSAPRPPVWSAVPPGPILACRAKPFTNLTAYLLVPVDFSPASLVAVRCARAIAPVPN